MVKDVRAICERWGFWTEGPLQAKGVRGKGPDEKSARRGIAILSHSNGSIAHGWLIKDCAEMILRNALVDPVVFCLWEGGQPDFDDSATSAITDALSGLRRRVL